ncbi:MAG: phenylalanine--tRNA ligase subunit alpha [Candidatus Hodarchaeales archaeon]|jgi:phenylalanyl-tRNA synthetase alpha chain
MNKQAISVSNEMYSLLKELKEEKSISIDELATILDIPRAKVELLTFQLVDKDLARREVNTITRAVITADGQSILKKGLPENQLITLLSKNKDGLMFTNLSSKSDLSKQEVNAGIGQLKKAGIVEIKKGLVHLIKKSEKMNEDLENTLRKYSNNPLYSASEETKKILLKRKLVEYKERQQTIVKMTKTASDMSSSIEISDTVSKLTPTQIRSGEWRKLQLKKYNIISNPKSIPVGRKHPYLMFLEEVKMKLIGLGFTEMRGPLVETEFWNFDALFQAQDHPAREWSDVYTLKHPSHGKLPADKELVNGVKMVHETGESADSRGWRYNWDPKKAARLLLRPQGTAVSARTLYNLPIPSKFFSIARCYRPDSVDATHLSEFNQMEGIVCDPSITFRDLLGILKTFAIEVAGATKVRFKPDYYPFTSPSVELSSLHPELGYIEFGGAGIFRPEVNAPFGIEDPVIAWGLGIDRLYMVKRGINDIRELFTHKLDWLRTIPIT